MRFTCVRKSKSKDVFKNLKKIENATLQIGWFDAKYEDGTPVYHHFHTYLDFGNPWNELILCQ